MEDAAIFLTMLAFVGVVLLVSEYAWRKKLIQGEIARKTVHIIVGSTIAFSPLFISVNSLRILAILLLAGVIVSRYLNFFSAIHDQRPYGYGEIFFALGILLPTLITETGWVITLALLHMSLADGLAAVIGMKYGLNSAKYKIFGQTKTPLGTFTFLGVSFALVLWTLALAPVDGFSGNSLLVIMLLPFIATICENFAPKSSDNIVISVVVAGLLSITL